MVLFYCKNPKLWPAAHGNNAFAQNYPCLTLTLICGKEKVQIWIKKNFEDKSQRKAWIWKKKSLDPEEKVWIRNKKFESGR